MNKIDAVPICDYEGSDYQTRFWTNQGRNYEDMVERIAIRKLLPPAGKRLLEIGAGFGRLVDMYQGYEQIVLLDYSKSLLREAQNRLGRDRKYTFIAANVYQLPLDDYQVDTACMIRVIHHLADVPQALRQIHRTIRPGGIFLLEFASKLHLKSILRYALRRQSWSPYDPSPIEFATLNFDFHPRWMQNQVQACGFQIMRLVTLSHFRLPLLKRLIPTRILAVIDGLLQPTGQWVQCAPSVMISARQTKGDKKAIPDQLQFRCPTCGQNRWQQTVAEMHCLTCHTRWPIDDEIYDFKMPIEA